MKNKIPHQLRFSHNYCVALHDELANFIVYGEENDLFLTKFEHNSPEEAKYLEENPDTDIWEWLEHHGREDVISEMLIKSMFPGLLSDLCHFIFEALSCSRKGKLTVAYALLRKPLRENLHYLEWLLADPNKLLNTFYNRESEELSFKKIGSPEKIKSMIQCLIDRLVHKDMFDSEFMYDLRYNKNMNYSFDRPCNQASHLITTKNPIQTEKQNFNFIFTGEETRASQWEHIYRYLPLILFYTVDLCDLLMAVILKEPMPDYAEASFHRSIGFILWGQEIYKYDNPYGGLSKGFQEFVLECPECKASIEPTEAVIKKLYDGDYFECRNCKKHLHFWSFIEEPDNN